MRFRAYFHRGRHRPADGRTPARSIIARGPVRRARHRRVERLAVPQLGAPTDPTMSSITGVLRRKRAAA